MPSVNTILHSLTKFIYSWAVWRTEALRGWRDNPMVSKCILPVQGMRAQFLALISGVHNTWNSSSSRSDSLFWALWNQNYCAHIHPHKFKKSLGKKTLKGTFEYMLFMSSIHCMVIMSFGLRFTTLLGGWWGRNKFIKHPTQGHTTSCTDHFAPRYFITCYSEWNFKYMFQKERYPEMFKSNRKCIHWVDV